MTENQAPARVEGEKREGGSSQPLAPSLPSLPLLSDENRSYYYRDGVHVIRVHTREQIESMERAELDAIDAKLSELDTYRRAVRARLDYLRVVAEIDEEIRRKEMRR